MIPEAYAGTDRNLAMDISLLELEEKVPISDNVKPAHVDWDNTLNLENGRILTVSYCYLREQFLILYYTDRDKRTNKLNYQINNIPY